MKSTTVRRARLAGVVTLAFAAAVSLLMPSRAEAVPLTINDPIYVASQAAAPLPDIEAGSVAHIFDQSIRLSSAAYFQAAWDAWNATQPANAQWTLVDGGSLANLGLTVSIFDAYTNHNNQHDPDIGGGSVDTDDEGVGGVEIRVNIDYNGADRDQLVWSQGLYDNYLLNGQIVTPFYEMDVLTAANVFQPPVYPYQYTDESFYDFPKAPFESSFFEADAFLSKVNYNTRTLTIYDGVEYGFYLYEIHVPEPTTWTMMLTGLAFAAAMVTKRRRARLHACDAE